MANCKHGIPEDWCSVCNPSSNPKKQGWKTQPTNTTTFIPALAHQGYGRKSRDVVITTLAGLDKRNASLEDLSKDTRFVHIQGYPFLCVIKSILDLSANIRVIQVTPKMFEKVSKTIKKLCLEKEIEIRSGYINPQLAWRDNENRSPFYKKKRAIFKSFNSEQSALFSELLSFGFSAAHITARYFCLNNEDFMPQMAVAKEFGYKPYLFALISSMIHAVIHYLDPNFAVVGRSLGMANNLRKKVLRIRGIVAEKAEMEKMLAGMGIENLPTGFPLARIDILSALIKARKSGALDKIKKRHRDVLVLRFGLDDCRYKTLEAIGDLFGVTREAIRQTETTGLKKLGISEELDA